MIIKKNDECGKTRSFTNTKKGVLSGYPNTEKWVKKRGAVDFFNLLRGVKIPDDTLFQMFHLASQTIDNSWRNSKQKFSSDFLCFLRI